MSHRARSRPTGGRGACAWIRRSRASSVIRGVEARTGRPVGGRARRRRSRGAGTSVRASRVTVPVVPEHDQAAEPVGGPVEAAGPAVLAHAVLDDQGAPVDGEPEPHAVDHADPGRRGVPGVGLGPGPGAVGDVLGREGWGLVDDSGDRIRRVSRSAVACVLLMELSSPWAMPPGPLARRRGLLPVLRVLPTQLFLVLPGEVALVFVHHEPNQRCCG